MEQKKSKKKWSQPNMEIISSDELKIMIVSGACSGFVDECTPIRISK